MQDIYLRAKSDCGYNATRFLQMISEAGGVETARRLLRGTDAQYGLQVLWEHGRLDLSVEAHVLKDEVRDLLSDEERQIAEGRLRAYGWTP